MAERGGAGGGEPAPDRSHDDEGNAMRGLMQRIRELTGVNGLGFDQASVIGLLLPIAIVVLIGGVGAIFVLVS